MIHRLSRYRFPRMMLQKLAAVWRCNEGNELAEFAVTLPIIAVLLVGILDFGMVINRKQELNNAAREGARWASNEDIPGDLTQTTPDSILSVRDVVVNYLTNAHVNTCGIGSATPTKSGWQWTFTANRGCPGTFTLVIDRGGQITVGGTAVGLSHVTLQYPYAWHFGRVIKLIAPGANFPGRSLITTDAYMQNL